MEVKTMEEKMMCLKEILLEEEIEELKNKKSKSVQKEVP